MPPRAWRSSRRQLVMGAAAAAASRATPSLAGYCTDVVPGLAPGAAPMRGTLPLGQANPRVLWGAAVESPGLQDAAFRQAVEAEDPRFLAIGSGLKFASLYQTPPPGDRAARLEPNWRECDEVVAWAGRRGVPFRGDCLAWNDALPDWLTRIAERKPRGWRDHLQGLFEQHFAAVFAHLAPFQARGAIPAFRWCGVLNEPFHPWLSNGDLAGWRPGPWLDAYGMRSDGVPGYIHRAFELGERHTGPAGPLLFFNEAHSENDHFGPKMRPAILGLVDALQTAGRRVAAVGLEAHLVPQWMADRANPDWRPFVTFLKALAARDVRVYLTELDVIDCVLRDTAERDALVAHYVATFVSAALETGVVDMVSDWDFADRYSWYREDAMFSRLPGWADCIAAPPCPRPEIYDEALRPKAARAALAKALAGRG